MKLVVLFKEKRAVQAVGVIFWAKVCTVRSE